MFLSLHVAPRLPRPGDCSELLLRGGEVGKWAVRLPHGFRELPGLPGVLTLFFLPAFVLGNELGVLLITKLFEHLHALIGLNQLLPDLGNPFAKNLPDLIKTCRFHGKLPGVIPTARCMIHIERGTLLQRQHLGEDRAPFVKETLPLIDQFLVFFQQPRKLLPHLIATAFAIVQQRT